MSEDGKVDPRVQAAKDRLNAEEKRAAHEAAGRDYSAAEKAAANAEKKAGMKSSGAAGKAAATPAGVRAMVSGTGIAGLWAANSKAGKGIMDKATTLLSKGGSAGAKAASVARFVPGLGMAASGIFALTEFRDGDYVGGALSLVGALPPPVGWVGLGSSLAWNTFFDDTGEISVSDPPDGANTFILPGSANEVEGVRDADASLTSAQEQVFNFADGPGAEVWKENAPPALRLDTEAVITAATAWLGGVSQAYSAITSELERSGEPYAIEYGSRLQPHSSAMAELAQLPTALGSQLTGASDAAATAYDAVLQANRSLRNQLSEAGSLSDRSSLDAADRALTAADTQVDRATAAITAGLVPAEVAPALVPAGGSVGAPAPAPSPSPIPGTPAPLAPGAPAPLTPGTAPKPDEKSDLAKLLESVGKQVPQMPQVPMGSGGNPLGGMGGGSPLGGGNPMGNGQGRKLDGGEGRKLDDKADRKLDDKERKPLEEKSDRKLSTAGGPANSVAAAPAPAGAAVGTPAVKPEAAVAKPGSPTKPTTEVDVKGEKVDFKDPKLAKMAQLLASATPQQPMSLSDAAAASGLTPPVPHADPGRQVQPVDAKPGDILVADGKQFMLLGEGRFYDLQDFKTVGASELPQDAGSRGGYFSLNDPRDPSGGGAPVSPPAGGVPHDIPGGQPPAATVDASPTGAGSGAVPSAGAPGVPATGSSGGPGGTAGTATGSGIPEPSSRTTSLDPAAVR